MIAAAIAGLPAASRQHFAQTTGFCFEMPEPVARFFI
jgi:hypothetical protein